jgi:peptide/nickel transport system substrate-binding protein
MKRVLIFALLPVLILSLALTGCAKKEAVRSLVYGTTEKVTDMDPASAYDFHTWEIFQNISTGLLAYKPGMTELTPALAESYTANAKGDEFTFKLRKGVKFTDGSVFDAAAVKWTIDRVIALKGDPSWLVSDFVKSVEVVDAQTVKFVLKQPVAYFPALVATPPYFPLPSKVYPKDKIVKNPDELTGKALVGLGAYKATSFKRDEEVVLDASPSYFGGEPGIKKIIIRYFADATTMRLALEKGEIDLAYKSMNPSDIKDLSANPNLVTNKLPGPYIRYLCYECSQSVFKDKKLRQAIGMLINRPEIVEKVYLNQNSPLYSMVPAGMIYHTEDFKALGDGNVAAAEKLLQSAGFSTAKPFAFDLWYTPTHYGDTEVNMAEVIKNQLDKTKLVKVTVKSAEWATYKEQWKNKQMSAYLLGWYPDYIDPDNYTAAFAGTTGSIGMGINFSNKDWDALFVKEQGNTDPAVRKQVFEQVQKMWTDEVPTVPIFQGDLYVFTKKNVTGVKIGPTLIFNYNQLQFTDAVKK